MNSFPFPVQIKTPRRSEAAAALFKVTGQLASPRIAVGSVCKPRISSARGSLHRGPHSPEALPEPPGHTGRRLRAPDAPRDQGPPRPARGRVSGRGLASRAVLESAAPQFPPVFPECPAAQSRLPCLRAAAMRVPRPPTPSGSRVPPAASASAPVGPPTTAGVPNPNPGSLPPMSIRGAAVLDWP